MAFVKASVLPCVLNSGFLRVKKDAQDMELPGMYTHASPRAARHTQAKLRMASPSYSLGQFFSVGFLLYAGNRSKIYHIFFNIAIKTRPPGPRVGV